VKRIGCLTFPVAQFRHRAGATPEGITLGAIADPVKRAETACARPVPYPAIPRCEQSHVLALFEGTAQHHRLEM
jgi:hypothetical protein